MAEVHNLWQKILKLLSKILKSDIVNTQTAKMLSKILKNRDVNTQHTQKRSKSSQKYSRFAQAVFNPLFHIAMYHLF